MTCPPNPQHEPTMEEILASIRKIISEDQGEAVRAAPQPAAQMPAQDAAMEASVIELTQEVRDDGSIAHVEAVEEPESQHAPEIQHNGNGMDDAAYRTNENTKPGVMEMSHDDLISDATRQGVDRAFDVLDEHEFQQQEAPMPAANGSGNSIEAAFEHAVATAFQPVMHQWVDNRGSEIMEQLKPLIRQWMDDNLPALIENAVRNEIARAVSNRRR